MRRGVPKMTKTNIFDLKAYENEVRRGSLWLVRLPGKDVFSSARQQTKPVRETGRSRATVRP
jgi:hypothetical protein